MVTDGETNPVLKLLVQVIHASPQNADVLHSAYSVSELLMQHAHEVDMASSLAQASVLMDPMEENGV